MRQQNTSAQPVKAAVVAGAGAEIMLRIDERSMPLAQISLPMRLERLCQRLQEFGRRALVTLSQSNGDSEFAICRRINLSNQSDIPILSRGKLPIHFEILHQVLPAIARAGVTHG